MVASKVCITGCQTVEWLTKHMVVSDILVGQNAPLSRGPRNEFHNSPAVIFCEGGQLELAKLRASITVKHTLTSLGCTQHEAQIWIWSWISAASKNSLPATATVCHGRQLALGWSARLPGSRLAGRLYSRALLYTVKLWIKRNEMIYPPSSQWDMDKGWMPLNMSLSIIKYWYTITVQ